MAGKHILADVCDCKRGGEIFLVSPDVIEIVDGWNARTDFSGEEELVDVIKSNGVPGVLEVFKTQDKRLELIDGERRLRAVRRANNEGAEIKAVPIIVVKRTTSESDRYINHMLRNSGKPFTPTEEAAAYKRLVNWGFDVKQIAERFGKSVSHVRNRLELAQASPEVQEKVNAGEITIAHAQNIAKSSDRIDEQSERLKKAPAPRKRNKLILSFKKGKLRRSGIKDSMCSAIEDLLTDDLKSRVAELGFNPESIRISVEKTDAE